MPPDTDSITAGTDVPASFFNVSLFETDAHKPVYTKQQNSTTICKDGTVVYTITNASYYQNAQYIWFKDTAIVQQGTQLSYIATDTGIYYVEVVLGNCSSASKRDTLKHGGTSVLAEIESVS